MEWADFMAANAVVEVRDFDGRIAENRADRPAGRPVSISWQPPANSKHMSGVLFGGAAIEASVKQPVRPGQQTPGWLLWLVAPDDAGRTATFKPRKLAAGLEVLADGVLPLYATRGDDWTLNSDVPIAEPLPAWLLDAFGGRRKRAA